MNIPASDTAGTTDPLRYFEADDLIISATRYYTGRMTISVSDHARRLARAWPQLSRRAQHVIRRDLEEAFERDDHARQEGKPWRALGMDCDREVWEEVRAAWLAYDKSEGRKLLAEKL